MLKNINAGVDSPVAAETAGDTETSVAVEAPASEVNYEYVDPSAFADKYVKVKVDGEEVSVPFNEAMQGYQRQADYTRKTQELAEQRNQLQFAQTLQQALETNPEATLEVLSRHYGVAAAKQMISDAQDTQPQVPQFDDPLEQRVWEAEHRIQQYEQERANQQLQGEIARLQSTYEDFNPQEIIREALRMGTSDLEGTYKMIAFDRLRQQVMARQQAQEVIGQQNQQVVDAKRDAAFVESGSSANAPTATQRGSISSVADAWAAAKQQIGI